MELIINSRGAKLSKSGDCFVVLIDEEKRELSYRNIDKILISTSCSITTDAIKLALEKDIDIVFIDYKLNAMGRIWNSKFGSIPTIRRNQLSLNQSELGLTLVKEWTIQKITNQQKHIKRISKTKGKAIKETANKAIERIQSYKEKILELKGNVELVRNTIEGYEGLSSREYFNVLNMLLPSEYKFRTRSKHPAKDMFNSLLNYSYAILYSKVEGACINAGIDPHIGILHTDNYNKKSIVYDIIENYRIYVDEVVFELCKTKKISDYMFEVDKEAYYLNKEGKSILIPHINEKLKSRVKYKGKNTEIENLINLQCKSIANRILKEEDFDVISSSL